MPAPPARPPAPATWRPAAGQVYDCPDGFQLQNVLEPKLTQKFVIILFSFSLERLGYSMIDILNILSENLLEIVTNFVTYVVCIAVLFYFSLTLNPLQRFIKKIH